MALKIKNLSYQTNTLLNNSLMIKMMEKIRFKKSSIQ